MASEAPPLRVGVDAAPPPPLCFGVPGDRDFKGFEVDLLRAVAARLSRELAWVASLWTELLETLQHGELDAVCTAATITPEREQRFAFSLPYLRTQLALICHGERPVSTLTGFEGHIGVRPGTPAEAYAERSGARVSRFHFNEEIYRALAERSLDVVVDDLPIGAWFAAQSAELRIGATLEGTGAMYGVVFARDAVALKAEFDGVLRSLLADGTYARLYDAWLKPLVGAACDVTVS
jgi:glutamine transport system substrate-binding protein